MSSRIPISFAVLGNLGVAAITLALVGWNAAGAHATARNTARFSALWCIAALASPALFRMLHRSTESLLIRCFVAAHAVHFVAVAALLLTFERSHILQHPLQSAFVIAIGSSVIVGLGLTAAGIRPFQRVVRSITLNGAVLIFFAAFFRHTVRSLRAIAVLLVVALALRLASGLIFWTARPRPT